MSLHWSLQNSAHCWKDPWNVLSTQDRAQLCKEEEVLISRAEVPPPDTILTLPVLQLTGFVHSKPSETWWYTGEFSRASCCSQTCTIRLNTVQMFCNSFHWQIFKLGKQAVFYNCIKLRKSIFFRIRLCYPANKVGWNIHGLQVLHQDVVLGWRRGQSSILLHWEFTCGDDFYLSLSLNYIYAGD